MTESLDDTLRGRIAYDGTRTPLKTTLFLLLCFTWLLPGLVGHDPWKVDEATAFGAVLEMLRSGDWLAFRIAGEPYFGDAPLYLWTAAACAKLFGAALALHDAARLASGVFVAVTLGFASLACRELMGERAPRMGVMLLIGCLGLLLRAHEMITALAGLAGVAMSLYGLALAERRPVAGGAMTGAGVGVAFLGAGCLPVGMLAMLMGLLPLTSPFWRTRRYALSAGVALLCAAPLLAAWPLALAHHSPAIFHAWLEQAGAASWNDPLSSEDGLDLIYFARILPWYAWPAWPLAAWSLWRSRRTLAARRDLLLPLVAFVAFFIMASVFGEAREVNALALLLPLAILGVAELDSLPRGAASALDWFGMTTFFLFGTMLWIGWLAATTGKPEFAHALISREVPGFRYHFDFVAVTLAALLTLIWLVVVARSLRSTRRALVNWASGIAMVWMLAMMLGLPLVDQAKSYRAVASRLVENLPRDFHCVARGNVGDAQRALLDYFVNLDTIPAGSPAAARCRALLVQASPLHVLAAPPGWTETWRGSRPGDRNELFLLYQRE
jgi:4-amino-4-deoxy-L-arabinose transferase-like glycosyltransferase